jgi:hypothetical protein
MKQRRTDGRFTTERAIRRVNSGVLRQSVLVTEVTKIVLQTPSAAAAAVVPTAANTARKSLRSKLDSSPGCYAFDATAATAASTTGAEAGTSTANATVLKYELHGDTALAAGVTSDTIMYSIASTLFKRGQTQSTRRSGCGPGVVHKVDVYTSTVTKAKFDAKRQKLAVQDETWVFHGTTSTDNVHSIMAEGFQVYTRLDVSSLGS